MERRVIISGKSLSTLTACIHALRTLLYPFVWQHVFVPLLPPPMIELCCSPTPLLIGILEPSLRELDNLPLEEVCLEDGCKNIAQLTCLLFRLSSSTCRRERSSRARATNSIFCRGNCRSRSWTLSDGLPRMGEMTLPSPTTISQSIMV